MPDAITEVHSITAADGWKFSNGEPVVCLALVTVISTAHPAIATKKMIVGISKDVILGEDICGIEVAMEMTMLTHESEE